MSEVAAASTAGSVLELDATSSSTNVVLDDDQIQDDDDHALLSEPDQYGAQEELEQVQERIDSESYLQPQEVQ